MSSYKAVAVGNFDWENQLRDGIWTYPLDLVWKGLQGSFASLKEDVKEKYGVELTKVGSIGISAMMHGYLVFDKDGKQLVPFRTWRNTITGEASWELTELFQLQYSPEMEHCPSVSGDSEWGRACEGYCVSDHAGRLYSLEADRREGAGRRRSMPACSRLIRQPSSSTSRMLDTFSANDAVAIRILAGSCATFCPRY